VVFEEKIRENLLNPSNPCSHFAKAEVAEILFGIIGFMSQNTEGVSDLGNLSDFLNLVLEKMAFCFKNRLAT
jgi:hypothetical protein